jgi:HAE1 family hydrophobic/amphiphilic exporter-1
MMGPVILIMGLIAVDSILFVDFTNQLREEGREVNATLTDACQIRMRPVLMTSFTVVFAMLPEAKGLGADSDANIPLSIPIFCGVTGSTLPTLLVVPAVYSPVMTLMGKTVSS